MRLGTMSIAILLLAGMCSARSLPSKGDWKLQERRDYLSQEEEDKIRDAETASERIKLYISFAEDRLKKLQYELQRTEPESNRSELLNGLLNGYSGSVDDAADQLIVGHDKGEDVRGAIKLMQDKCKDFLAALQRIEKDAVELDTYKDTLEDAIEGTKDALDDANKAAKDSTAPPVRRKPS
ncbi:MAG: hypothetical protein ACRD50_09240 [Candidatus Acidiferrales bacterium]